MSIPLFNTPEEHTLFWTKKLAERSARLLRLTELNGPTFVINNERRLVFDAIARLPADAHAMLQADNMDEQTAREKDDALEQAGWGLKVRRELGVTKNLQDWGEIDDELNAIVNDKDIVDSAYRERLRDELRALLRKVGE